MNRQVLVIDDDPAVLELIQEVLEKDFDVRTAFDVPEGVDLMLEHHFDLLIVDLGLPVLGGVDLIEALRANEGYQQVPILVVSAFPELRARVKGKDVQAILSKPFSVDELARTARKLLSDHDARQTAPAP